MGPDAARARRPYRLHRSHPASCASATRRVQRGTDPPDAGGGDARRPGARLVSAPAVQLAALDCLARGHTPTAAGCSCWKGRACLTPGKHPRLDETPPVVADVTR